MNYMQVVQQTHEEKMAMYMKMPKKKLAEMLINCNNIIADIKPMSYLNGWICPRCRQVHSPYSSKCDCPPETITSSLNNPQIL